ncbi:MAG: hypothetical protein NT079_04275, partial [Candidatus Omnitrophica bacterium]|nr:hypothetical protein [Candidatus Omnitrophota bacterium]
MKQQSEKKENFIDRLRNKENIKPKILADKAKDDNGDKEKAVATSPVAGAVLKPKITLAQPDLSKPDCSLAKEPPRVVGEYHFPSVDLLKDPPAVSAQKVQDDLVLGA